MSQHAYVRWVKGAASRRVLDGRGVLIERHPRGTDTPAGFYHNEPDVKRPPVPERLQAFAPDADLACGSA